MDGRGNVDVNATSIPGRGIRRVIALVTPDGSVRKVADANAFLNGMVVTPDNSS